MEQGFWLFFIFQLLALGLLSERMNLVGLRRMALLAGIGGSLCAALFVLIINYGDVSGPGTRSTLRWLMLATTMASIIATAASVALPPEMSRKRA